MSADSPQVRAPRLTDNRLGDLELVVTALASEIQYLAEAMPAYAKGSPIQAKLQERHGALVRGSEWIAGKVLAERAQRTADGNAGVSR